MQTHVQCEFMQQRITQQSKPGVFKLFLLAWASAAQQEVVGFVTHVKLRLLSLSSLGDAASLAVSEIHPRYYVNSANEM